MQTYQKRLRFIAVFLALNILVESVAPYTAFALTSGPTQPEFSSFEPVATTNMVDPFSGNFTYNLPVINIPGPNGGGYGVSLSYHSGSKMEEEASWVGYGWTLNPGAINRNKSGFPDDIKGGEVSYVQNVPSVFSVSGGLTLQAEFYGLNSPTLGVIKTLNSNKGFGRTTSLSVGLLSGISTLSFSVTDGSSSFDANVNPAVLFSRIASRIKKTSTATKMRNNPLLTKGLRLLQISGMTALNQYSNYGIQSLFETARPTTIEEYSGYSINVDGSIGPGALPVPLNPEIGVSGSFTRQKSQKSDKKVYGSMFIANGINSPGAELDYFVEKESYYNKRDLFLSIPYQGCDVYSVMGEGIGGGFKYKHDNVGHYSPTPLHNHTPIFNGSVEVTIGLDMKPATGFGLGVGEHILRTNAMMGQGNYYDYAFPSTSTDDDREDGYFRFTGDLSNTVSYSYNYNDEAVSATVKMRPYPKYIQIDNTKLSNKQLTAANETQRAYRSNYVGYTSYADFKLPESDGGKYLRSYTRDIYTRDLIAKSIPSEYTNLEVIDNQITELYSVSEGGNTYVYGLPVFSYKEKTVTKYLDVVTGNGGGGYVNMADATLINSAENSTVSQKSDLEVSESHNYPYVNSHLLTQITTADYIDRTFDGPTPDDFGGWTKFNYVPGQPYAANSTSSNDYRDPSNWYGWRTPYSGFEYERGSLSMTSDDLLQYSEGKKQQYFVESIETKTHIAYFVTNLTDKTITNDKGEVVIIRGSLKARIDGASASSDNSAVGLASQTSRKLERVILFAKSNQSSATNTVVNGKPLKIANLEYYGYPINSSTQQAPLDISKALCKAIPNKLTNSIDNPFGQDGKLTLKRVWFEYEGVVNAKISPYEFFYEYKTNWSLPTDIQLKYASIISYNNTLTAQDQNPDYNPLNSNAWGDYMEDGSTRALALNNTVPQVATPHFDPAAWQLKRIVLPSGGEVLVQYEQADYKYVHDESATILTKLMDPDNPSAETKKDKGNSEEHYLDLSSIGISTQADIDAIFPVIDEYLKQHKLYFKFLYSLNNYSSTVKIGDCNVEYIDGYANAKINKDASGKLFITFPSGDGENYTLPKKVCADFFLKERKGLRLTAECDNSDRIPITMPVGENRTGVMSMIMTVVGSADPLLTNICDNMSLVDSYIRIPVLYGKKGGGVRVKRVMMYDPGLETGDQMLYGSEYIYKLSDNKTSSGVAVNEPHDLHEENALVDFLQKRAPKSLFKKIISGKDKEQFEGPVGEGLLSSPSIGYSRVVVKNIHTGKTNTGFTVQEFHTVKDYPISKWGTMTSIKNGNAFPIFVPGIVISASIDKRHAAQGYAFVLSEIHGKPKRIATYSGDYDVNSSTNPESTSYMSYQELFEYTQPGEYVTVMDYNGTLKSMPLGRDEEIVMEMRSVSDITNKFSVDFDAAMGFAGIVINPSLTVYPRLATTEKEMNTHVTNKIVRYTPLLKKTISFKDGVTHLTENKVFSISNGTPLVTVTYDGYDALNLQQSSQHQGAYANYSVPADFIYKGLSGKFKNEKLTYVISGSSVSVVNTTAGKYKITIPQNIYDKGYCSIGDLIKVSLSSNATVNGFAYIIDLVKQGATYDMVLQTLPETSLGRGLIGAPQDISVFVIHSGFSNQLNLFAAGVTTYGDNISALVSPLIFTNGQSKLRAFSNAIQVSTQTYKGTRPYDDAIDTDYNLSVDYNEYLAGRTGKWRAFETYTQKKPITPSNTTGIARVYSGGTFASDLFDFDPLATNALWTKTNTITLYSPDGNPLEEKNILNIYSTAKFGYGGSLPVLVAKNSQYSSAFFNGFEEYPNQTKMGVQMGQFLFSSNIVKGIAHTGTQSLEITSSGYVNYSDFKNNTSVDFQLAISDQLVNKGMMTRMWVKIDPRVYSNNIGNNLSIECVSSNGSIPVSLAEISRVGDWILIEGIVPKQKFVKANGSYTIRINNKSGVSIYVDDIRLQPFDSEMACYVYDPKNLRLLASFDDQHFALIYQYNAEGKLLRKLVETEKGIKTITESQFNTPQKAY